MCSKFCSHWTKYITSVSNKWFFQQWQIHHISHPVNNCLPLWCTEFVTSCVNYCLLVYWPGRWRTQQASCNVSSMQLSRSYQTVENTTEDCPLPASCSRATLAWRHWSYLVQAVLPGVQVSAQHDARIIIIIIRRQFLTRRKTTEVITRARKDTLISLTRIPGRALQTCLKHRHRPSPASVRPRLAVRPTSLSTYGGSTFSHASVFGTLSLTISKKTHSLSPSQAFLRLIQYY